MPTPSVQQARSHAAERSQLAAAGATARRIDGEARRSRSEEDAARALLEAAGHPIDPSKAEDYTPDMVVGRTLRVKSYVRTVKGKDKGKDASFANVATPLEITESRDDRGPFHRRITAQISRCH